ncbi:hypothetical protein A2U01_0114483, partial [Trifolium medium]|nr:hypothetical protein [Trifolium medium]
MEFWTSLAGVVVVASIDSFLHSGE